MALGKIPTAGLLALLALGLLVSDAAAGGEARPEQHAPVEEMVVDEEAVAAPVPGATPKWKGASTSQHQVAAVAKPSSAKRSSPKLHKEPKAATKAVHKVAKKEKKRQQRQLAKQVVKKKAAQKKKAAHKAAKKAAHKAVKKAAKEAAKNAANNAAEKERKMPKTVPQVKRKPVKRGIMGPSPPLPEPHPVPKPGAPRSQNHLRTEALVEVSSTALEKKDVDEEDSDMAEEMREDAKEAKVAEEEAGAAADSILAPPEVDEIEVNTAQAAAHKSAPATGKKAPSHLSNTLDRIKALRGDIRKYKPPEVHKRAPAVFETQVLTQVKMTPLSSYGNIPDPARKLVRDFDERTRDTANEVEEVADNMGGIDVNDQPTEWVSRKDDTPADTKAFYKNKLWMIGAGESYGGQNGHTKHMKAIKAAAQGIKDFAMSDNAQSSAQAGFTLANLRRIQKGKFPTVFAQESDVERSQDPKHVHGMLHYHFRFMRGAHPGPSKYRRWKAFRQRQAAKRLRMLAGIRKNGRFYDQDGMKERRLGVSIVRL